MHVKPQPKYIVCQAIDNTKLSSGIYVPDSQKEKRKYLQVIETASEFFKKKDLVIPKGGMMETEVDLQKYYIIHEDEICATLEK